MRFGLLVKGTFLLLQDKITCSEVVYSPSEVVYSPDCLVKFLAGEGDDVQCISGASPFKECGTVKATLSILVLLL